MKTLQAGLSESTKGINEVNTGITDAQDYLTGLRESNAPEKLNIPQNVLKSDEFKTYLNIYI